MSRLGLYLHSARHLRASQVAWRLVHELRLRAYRRAPRLLGGAWRARSDVGLAAHRLEPIPPALLAAERAVAARWRAGEVAYHGIVGPRDDWRAQGRTRLWRYERHYHSELVALAALAASEPEGGWLEEARGLVDGWARACPPVAPDAWEPYPVARRLLNWSLAAALAPALGSALAPGLAAQARFLAAHLERHLRGNHLLCDAAALVAAGAVLEDGARHLARGERLLVDELRAQVLGDGGYAERTVQYHAIVLRDVLVAAALAHRRGHALDPAVLAAARSMTAWLAAVRRADGSFPVQNDAVPEATPALGEVLALARALGLTEGAEDGWLARAFGGGAPAASAPAPASATDLVLAETGWAFVREGGHELLFDFGPLGPDEQPGHGHSDTLAFELLWDGKPLVVDTGVTTYEPNEVRAFERSARAHATVAVAGEGPDELWAAFRVARRGRLLDFHLARHGPVRILAAGLRAPAGWEHRRTLVFWPGRALVVVDRVEGARGAEVVARLPLAPGLALDGIRFVGVGAPVFLDVIRGRLRPPLAGSVEPREGWISAGFERAVPRASLAIAADRDGEVVCALRAEGVEVSVEKGWCTIRASGAAHRVEVGGRGAR